jgi:serine/threonine protein kinase/DNA/RNA endonuclease YhcR with UshA esterase domain
MSFSRQSQEAILQAALKLPPKDRAAYLDQACAGDEPLRQRIVESIFKAGATIRDGPEQPASPPPAGTIAIPFVSEPQGEKPGDRIGRYKLLERIGEGGMGSVWVAEQTEPVRREVALKVIKLGMDTRQVIARFEAERQALALMDHPNIAKVLDAGATDTGRPYFAMERIKGVPITKYCDDKKLDTRQRLDLFMQVCQAIQHAHQKGIIHRDIKPSNILVGAPAPGPDGVKPRLIPKVIDFGIAKATGGQVLTDKSLHTMQGQVVGTPVYMAPEQTEMGALDVDTRSDIYSLGVLLYELLTGQTPFDAQRLASSGLQVIREEDPLRPSTRLSSLGLEEQTTVAKRRQTEPPKLIHLIRGDLDWIVLKTLEKDRARRYETANGLVRDIERYLANEPVAARSPSNLYRFQKLIRRNKLAFVAATTLVAGLALGLTAATLMYWREARTSRQLAASRDEERRSKEVVTKAKDIANENSSRAQQAFDELLNVSTDIRAVTKAVDSYRRFHEQSPDDPALTAKLATLLQRQASTYLSSTNGDSKETGLAREGAAAAARESSLLLEQLTAAFPANAVYAEAFADACAIAAQAGPPEARQAALAKCIELLSKRLPVRWQTEQKLASLLSRLQETQTNQTELRQSVKQQIDHLERAHEGAAAAGHKGATTPESDGLLDGISRAYEKAAAFVPEDDSAFYLEKAASSLRTLLARRGTNGLAADPEQDLVRLAMLDERLAKVLLDRGRGDEGAKVCRLWISDSETLSALGNRAAAGSVTRGYNRLAAALEGSPVSASDVMALRAFARRKAIVKGTVGAAEWSPARTVINVRFSDAEDGCFGAIFARDAPRFQQVFGEDLDEALSGRTVQLRGTLADYNGTPQIVLSDATQIALLGERSSRDKQGVPVLRASDTGGLLAAVYKKAVVTGTIDALNWTAGLTLQIRFKDVPKDGFIAVVFDNDVDSLSKALGGDATVLLPGKSVRIEGKISKFKGQPEVLIRKPAQLVIEAAPTSKGLAEQVSTGTSATNVMNASPNK